MVTATSPCVRSNNFNTCGATISAPFLLSPTSVAHRIQKPDSETGRHSTGNAIRDQWVANLQNRRMAAAAGTGDPIGSGNRAASSLLGKTTSTTGNSKSGLAKKSRNAAQLNAGAHEKSLNTRQLTAHQHSQFATMPSRLMIDSQITMRDADAITLEQSTTLFNAMSCFELESPLDSHLVTPATITKKSRGWMKRGTKAGSRKRTTHYQALHADQSKTHTHRRKRNCGSAESDIFDFDYYSVVSNASGFPDVETPSDISVDASCANTRYLWGQDIDFSGAGGYADTFIDSPTPELADMPLMLTPQWSNISSTTSNSSKQSNDEEDVASKFDLPQSIHTSSIELEGFNQFFEQTNLDITDGGHGDELYQLATTPLVSNHNSPFSGGSCFIPVAAAATEYCGGKPATLSSSCPPSSPSPISTSPRPDASTARCRMTPGDEKHPPELKP